MAHQKNLETCRKAVFRAILMAQDASDAGKGHRRYGAAYYPGWNNARVMGYSLKQAMIIRALRMIDTSPPMGISYWVEYAPDQNGFDSVLVYFEWKEDRRRFQVSFHNPARKAGDLLQWVGKGRQTHWNHKMGGSRESCDYLNAKYF